MKKDYRSTKRESRWLRHLLFALLVGGSITLLLTFLEFVLAWLRDPSHLAQLVSFSLQNPSSLLPPLSEFVLTSLATFLLARPLLLILYLQRLHSIQGICRKLYIPLMLCEDDPEYTTAITAYHQHGQISVLDLIQQQAAHQLILGMPGTGKTMALRMYQYLASQSPFSLAFSHKRIPVYIPMGNYNLFLKKYNNKKIITSQESDSPTSDLSRDRQLLSSTKQIEQGQEFASLLQYLQESDLPAMRYLKPFLQELIAQGRLLLLCDGLDEVEASYQPLVREELRALIAQTPNRLIITSGEDDDFMKDIYIGENTSNFRTSGDLSVRTSAFAQTSERMACGVPRWTTHELQIERTFLHPLSLEQIHTLVEGYVERQDKHWKHTAGQIQQLIERTRFRYLCTNPMLLFVLMGIIDRIGIERGMQIDTRGWLLREYVRQFMEYEGRRGKWTRNLGQQKVADFLSEIACASDGYALQLLPFDQLQDDMNDQAASAEKGRDPIYRVRRGGKIDLPALAAALHEKAHENKALFRTISQLQKDELARLLQFALSATLIDISPSGVISFRHKVIADYFIAEYLCKTGWNETTEFFEDVARWSGPIAIWASLLDDPLALAEHFGSFSLQNSQYWLPALAFGLACVGVLWMPLQADVQRTIILPTNLEESLKRALGDESAREDLACLLNCCAQEGNREVYRALLSLIMMEGIEDLLILLGQTVIVDLLFGYLQDAADHVRYENQVKRLVRILGRFGRVAVRRAVQLSMPTSEHSPRLRAAAINILGGGNDGQAVELLLAHLRDADSFIVERAANALIRLGPDLTFPSLLQELESQATDSLTMRVHRIILTIFGYFLKERQSKRALLSAQINKIIQQMVAVLITPQQAEQNKQLAREILVREGRNATDDMKDDVLEECIAYLSVPEEKAARQIILVLQEIGTPATLPLIDLLDHPMEMVRLRAIALLQEIRDLRALPALLQLLQDSSPALQQALAEALYVYAPESIRGLLERVVGADHANALAKRAASILADIGSEAVPPIIEILPDVVPERAILLVQVLERVHDEQAIPAFITLLQNPQLENLLALATIRALGQFQDAQATPALLVCLSSPDPHIYEEAIIALSEIGEILLPALINTFEDQDEVVIQRVQRAILGMMPFPGEQLIGMLEERSDRQIEQMMAIFIEQGSEAASLLVKHLLYPDERVRNSLQWALEQTSGAIAVPALLEGLYQPELREIASIFLLKYPDSAIPPLVNLLGEQERAALAAEILPQFGPLALRPLLVGLDDPRSLGREFARRAMLDIVQLSPEKYLQNVLHEIIHLFHPLPPPRAHEELLDLLTQELADLSLDELLAGLEDAHLIESVAEAFVRLARQSDMQELVLDNLIASLGMDERRHGVQIVLTKIGAPAVPHVGELIIHQQRSVATAAKQILRDIGVPALPFIWGTQSNRADRAMREAALEVFHSMPTEIICDELVQLLVSERQDDIAMAVALLLERINEENKIYNEEQLMVAELVKYMKTHTHENINLRIIGLLLLLGERTITDPLLKSLEDDSHPCKQIIYALLLLGNETQRFLLQRFNNPSTAIEVRLELAAILGMKAMPQEITNYAQNISKYGLVANRSGVLFPEEHAVALRALGGLLASGHWDTHRLQELLYMSKSGHPARELFNILLGWRYEPQIAQLQSDFATMRDNHKKQVMSLTGEIIAEKNTTQNLKGELEKIRREQGTRGDELHQISTERKALLVKIDQLTKENKILQATLAQLTKEKSPNERK